MWHNKVVGVNYVIVKIEQVNVNGAVFVFVAFLACASTMVFNGLATKQYVVCRKLGFYNNNLIVKFVIRRKPPCLAGIYSRFFQAIAYMFGDVCFNLRKHGFSIA